MSAPADPAPAWIPLNVHSQFSILDSTASVQALAEKAKSFGSRPWLSRITGNLYGAVDFFKTCKEAADQADHRLRNLDGARQPAGKKTRSRPLAGIPDHSPCKNQTGYRNLCRLSSLGFLEGFYYQPRIDKELLAAHREGLICLSGPMNGQLGVNDLAWERKRTPRRNPMVSQLYSARTIISRSTPCDG